MAKPYLIHFWHGMSGVGCRSREEKEFIAKLESICGPADGVNNIFFEGTLMKGTNDIVVVHSYPGVSMMHIPKPVEQVESH